jgi:hypothetical protein
VLVAELVRARGWELFRDPLLRLVVSEQQWSETHYEIARRLNLRAERNQLTADQISLTRQEIQLLLDAEAIEVVPCHVYEQMKATARRRIPRDPDDWPTVALALALGVGILTSDNDFPGCGCPTWTVDTLRDELAQE